MGGGGGGYDSGNMLLYLVRNISRCNFDANINDYFTKHINQLYGQRLFELVCASLFVKYFF